MSEPNILGMDLNAILGLEEKEIRRYLTPDEVVHISKTLGAFWTYDYHAADQDGKVGYHARLKAGLCSDAFFVSKILLKPLNIRRIMAGQIAMRVLDKLSTPVHHVIGVPDGATDLGLGVALFVGTHLAAMEKVDGNMKLLSTIFEDEYVLLIEDFCTRGTGFTEAARLVKAQQPKCNLVPFNPVIINRGGLDSVHVEELGDFKVLPVVDWRVNDWSPEECPLCKMGSTPIKPKATDENWELITHSQL